MMETGSLVESQKLSQEGVTTQVSEVSWNVDAPQSQTTQRKKSGTPRISAKSGGRSASIRNTPSPTPSQQNQVVPSSSQNDEAIEDEGVFIVQDIELLQQYAINVADINKLKSVGICTVKGVQMTTRKKLINIRGLSEAKVDKIKEAAGKINTGCGRFMSARTYGEQRRCIFNVSTGSAALNGILGGGLQSMGITEVFGEFRCGKTQISHTCCVTCQIPDTDTNYPGGKALFIDTENTFRPDRLREIADRFQLDGDATLDNVLYARAFTSDQQMELLDMAAAKFHEERGLFKLLVVDSVMALFRVDYCGRGELAERQQKLAQMMSRLQKISEEYNVSVLITNQMTADPGATMTFQADPKKPIGGHILAHASTTRVQLRKGRGEIRVAKIYDSPELPENEASFAITAGGIADAGES